MEERGFYSNMTVTILTPIYGVERYIADCAESLFTQTYPDIEYVFCDDCTPDDSIRILEEVLQRYPERKNAVRIIRNERNSGIGMTRARLLKEVRTDCFFFADSDDLLPREAIATLVKRMKETGTDIVDGAYREYSDGREGHIQLPSHCDKDTYLARTLCQNIENHNVWGRLYKTSVLQKLPEMFFNGIDCAEDYCVMARLLPLVSRSWTDEVVYLYRTDNQSSYTKSASERNVRSCLHANKEVLRFYHLRGHLPFSLEIGMLNGYRICRSNGFPLSLADEIMRYVPQHYRARLLYWLLHNHILYNIGDALYRVLRLKVGGIRC